MTVAPARRPPAKDAPHHADDARLAGLLGQYGDVWHAATRRLVTFLRTPRTPEQVNAWAQGQQFPAGDLAKRLAWLRAVGLLGERGGSLPQLWVEGEYPGAAGGGRLVALEPLPSLPSRPSSDPAPAPEALAPAAPAPPPTLAPPVQAALVRLMDARRPAKTTLKEVERELGKLRLAGATGPLRIAELVVPVLEAWADYAAEAEGRTAEQWAARVLGSRSEVKRARLRVALMGALEEAMGGGPESRAFVRGRLHDKTVLLFAEVPAERRHDAVLALATETRKRGMLEPGAARRVLREVSGALSARERAAGTEPALPAEAPDPALLSADALAVLAWVNGPLDAWIAQAIEAAHDGKKPGPLPAAPDRFSELLVLRWTRQHAEEGDIAPD